MAVRFLFDEHLRGLLGRAVQRHSRTARQPIDFVGVGDPPDLPLGSQDPDLLAWAEREGRVLVSFDQATMPAHFAAHLSAGRSSPGVFFFAATQSVGEIIDTPELYAQLGDPDDYRDRLIYH